MTRADKIRAHIYEADRTLADMTEDEEIRGYLDCANLFALLEIAAQLAEVNEKLHAIAETYVLGGGKR